MLLRVRALFPIGAFAVVLTLPAYAEPPTKVESTPTKVEIRNAKVQTVKPPVARVEVVKDTYFGETLDDPYRWMENDKDPGWLPFLKAENDYTRAVLGIGGFVGHGSVSDAAANCPERFRGYR
jgi:Prolyl oligopeptidase, N-terminal beta-propeller domain